MLRRTTCGALPGAMVALVAFIALDVIIAFVPASIAEAQTAPPITAAVRTEVYVDDDGTRVVRPRGSVSVPVAERVSVGASYLADVVSSASIDVVTRASQAIREVHQEATVNVARVAPNEGSVSVGYGFVHEPDYLANSVSLIGGRDLGPERAFHLSGRLVGSVARIGAVMDPRFEKNAYSFLGTVSVSRIVNARLLVRGHFEVQNLSGFLGSAYRTVRIGDWTGYRYSGNDPDALAWVFQGVTATVRESVPHERLRTKLSFEAVRDLGSGFAIFTNVSGYVDTWSIGAGDATLELRYEPRPRLLLRASARAYLQSASFFWRQRYADPNGVDGYVTDDKELGPMQSYTGVFAASVPIRDFRLDLRVEGTRYHYPEFTLLPDRRALATQVAVVWRH